MTETTDKLYLVELRGLNGYSSRVVYGTSYVVAKNSDEAYKKVRKFLDADDLGFEDERELLKITLLAEDYEYTTTRTLLFL
jgi:hypothetical protein